MDLRLIVLLFSSGFSARDRAEEKDRSLQQDGIDVIGYPNSDEHLCQYENADIDTITWAGYAGVVYVFYGYWYWTFDLDKWQWSTVAPIASNDVLRAHKVPFPTISHMQQLHYKLGLAARYAGWLVQYDDHYEVSYIQIKNGSAQPRSYEHGSRVVASIDCGDFNGTGPGQAPNLVGFVTNAGKLSALAGEPSSGGNLKIYNARQTLRQLFPQLEPYFSNIQKCKALTFIGYNGSYVMVTQDHTFIYYNGTLHPISDPQFLFGCKLFHRFRLSPLTVLTFTAATAMVFMTAVLRTFFAETRGLRRDDQMRFGTHSTAASRVRP